jgi:hypothetical protein
MPADMTFFWLVVGLVFFFIIVPSVCVPLGIRYQETRKDILITLTLILFIYILFSH